MEHSSVIRLELPADYQYLDVLATCITTMLEAVDGLAEPQILMYDIQLAVQETYTNIVRHAYANQPGRKIEAAFTLDPTPRRFIIELHDTGQSFNPATVPAPDWDNVQNGGLGLYLIRQLMDEVVYRPHPEKNYWRLVRYLPCKNGA